MRKAVLDSPGNPNVKLTRILACMLCGGFAGFCGGVGSAAIPGEYAELLASPSKVHDDTWIWVNACIGGLLGLLLGLALSSLVFQLRTWKPSLKVVAASGVTASVAGLLAGYASDRAGIVALSQLWAAAAVSTVAYARSRSIG